MRYLVVFTLLLASPAAAQTMPKIDAQNCLDVAKKLDATAWDALSEETKSYSRICFAAYWCDKAKKITTDWNYEKKRNRTLGRRKLKSTPLADKNLRRVRGAW